MSHSYEIRNAILKAAETIELHPSLFNYHSNSVPKDCGTPGCAIGWVSYHLGHVNNVQTYELLGLGGSLGQGIWNFSGRMDEFGWDRPWRRRAETCASTLRLYADKYHPAPERNFARELMASLPAERIPDEVRA